MPWTYRVVKRTWPDRGYGPTEVTFGVHEAYDDGDIEKPHSISTNAVVVSGVSVEDLRASHERMAKAFDRPVLDYAAFDLR